METSPLDITQREFTRKMRGYDPEEVRTFQEQIAEEMTRLVQQGNDQAALIQRLDAQVKGYQEREDSLRNTLVTAQKMTEEIKGNAKREADLIMKEAELRAEKLLDQARTAAEDRRHRMRTRQLAAGPREPRVVRQKRIHVPQRIEDLPLDLLPQLVPEIEIVHRIVTQKFGGTIDVESEPGHTQFTVRLPLVNVAAQAEGA